MESEEGKDYGVRLRRKKEGKRVQKGVRVAQGRKQENKWTREKKG